MTLYELTDQLVILAEMAEDPEVDPETLADTMDAVEGEFSVKAEGYARVLRHLDAQEQVVRAEASRLLKRADAIGSNAKRIRERLKESMERTGQRDIRTDLFHLYVRKNKASVIIDNPDAVSDKYLRPQPPKIDKAAIKEDLDNGKELDWCHTEQSTSLIIR